MSDKRTVFERVCNARLGQQLGVKLIGGGDTIYGKVVEVTPGTVTIKEDYGGHNNYSLVTIDFDTAAYVSRYADEIK